MTQPVEAGITGIGEVVHWDSSAPAGQFLNRSHRPPQGFGGLLSW
jgi:hypothetical protein